MKKMRTLIMVALVAVMFANIASAKVFTAVKKKAKAPVVFVYRGVVPQFAQVALAKVYRFLK